MAKTINYAKRFQKQISDLVDERDDARGRLTALLLILSDDEVHGIHMFDPYKDDEWKEICEYAVKCRDAHVRECEKLARKWCDEQWERERRKDPAEPHE